MEKKKVLKTYEFFKFISSTRNENIIFDKPIEYLSILIQDSPVKRIKIYRLYKSFIINDFEMQKIF